MTAQIHLELYPLPKPRPVLKYSDLNINQKINVKANSCGFEFLWIWHSALCWSKSDLLNIYRSHHPEMLTEKWFWHITHNHGGRKGVFKYNPELNLFRMAK